MRRFRYIRMDMAKLTARSLEAICRQHLRVSPEQVNHWHISWMCNTTSPADRGLSGHRWQDASPRSDRAKRDDLCLEALVSALVPLHQANQDMLITWEQPNNDVWLRLPAMRRLLRSSDQWRIITATHCTAASSEMDQVWQVYKDFPRKLTDWVVAGLVNGYFRL